MCVANYRPTCEIMYGKTCFAFFKVPIDRKECTEDGIQRSIGYAVCRCDASNDEESDFVCNRRSIFYFKLKQARNA